MNETGFDPKEYENLKRKVAQEVVDKGFQLIKEKNLQPDDNGFYHLRVLMDIETNPEEEKFVQNCGILYREFVDGVGFVDGPENTGDSDTADLTFEEIMAKPQYRTVIWNPDDIKAFLDSKP